MEIKLRHSVSKIISETLAIVLAVSIVMFSASIVFLACFQSDSFVKKNLQSYSPEVIECVNNRLEELAQSTGFPAEAYTSCFDNEMANLVYDKIINNIKYSYVSDFSSDEDIYRLFKSNLTNYCYDNNVDVSNKDISINSSLAVDAINEVLGGNSTTQIRIMNFAKSKKMVVLVFAPIVLIVACLSLIDIINKGRHRRLNYYGMGVTTAGAMMTIVTAYVLIMNYTGKYQFCSSLIYNSAITDITNFALKVIISAGVVCIVVGFIILLNNYHYFAVKEKNQLELRENKTKMRSDYMLEFEQKKSNAPNVENEVVEYNHTDE